MKWSVRVFILCAMFPVWGCSTLETDRKVQATEGSGPASCDIGSIEKWIRQLVEEKFSSLSDYSFRPLRVLQTQEGWEVYFGFPDDGKIRSGGSPTAILDRDSCELKDLYITQ